MARPRRSLMLAAALALLAGCGAETGEVRLDIQEDASSPCLGAAHLLIQVLSPQGLREHHEFGQFFRENPLGCVNGEYRYEGLDFSNAVQITVKMYDSTSDLSGLLASGTSMPIDVKAGSPVTQLVVTLARTDARLGTVRMSQKPVDWDNYPGVDSLQFSVTVEGETVPQRSGYLSVTMERMANPFPVIVSNLPLPAVSTQLNVRVDALGAFIPPDVPPVLHTWTGTAFLGGDAPNPADLLLQ